MSERKEEGEGEWNENGCLWRKKVTGMEREREREGQIRPEDENGTSAMNVEYSAGENSNVRDFFLAVSS